MNPAASRPTEATNTTTAQPSELGFTTTSLDLPLEAPPHNVDTRLNEQSHFLYDQSRANNEVFSTIGIINGRPDSTERQLITFIQPPEAIPQYPHFARSPWPLAPTLGSFTTGFDVVNTPPLFNANYGALATLLPPAGSFDFANTLGLPATSSDTEYPPMMLMSSFEYTHHLVPPAGVSDVPHALMPPAGIFDTGHIFAPLAAGFSAGYTIALPGVSSVIAHTLVPLTTGFEPVLTFAPLDADFDTVSAISSRVTSSDAASASPSIAPSCSASPSIAQPPPKRHKVNLREGSEIVQSSDSETGVSNSGQNGSTIIIRDSADEDVTADQFSEFFKQFIFIRLEMIPIVYLQLVGRELAATSISPQELNRQLGNVEGFESWLHDLHEVDVSFLACCGARYLQTRLRLNRRLRIAEGAAAVVPALLLSFQLLTLGCANVKQLPNAVLARMFETTTGCVLSSRLVIATSGPQTYSTLKICELARVWLVSLCTYIIKYDRMHDLLVAADKYYEECKKKCGGRVNAGAVFDPGSSIGQEMLESDDPAIELILGLHRKDLLELYKFLPCMTDGMLVDAEMSYLKLHVLRRLCPISNLNALKPLVVYENSMDISFYCFS